MEIPGLDGCTWVVEFPTYRELRRGITTLTRCHQHHFVVTGAASKTVYCSELAQACLREAEERSIEFRAYPAQSKE